MPKALGLQVEPVLAPRVPVACTKRAEWSSLEVSLVVSTGYCARCRFVLPGSGESWRASAVHKTGKFIISGQDCGTLNSSTGETMQTTSTSWLRQVSQSRLPCDLSFLLFSPSSFPCPSILQDKLLRLKPAQEMQAALAFTAILLKSRSMIVVTFAMHVIRSHLYVSVKCGSGASEDVGQAGGKRTSSLY
jgi:hypothetical protein